MNLYVYDKFFTLLGIIDSYESLIWIRDYYGIGTLELHTQVDVNTLNLLRKGNIVIKEDDMTEAMYIDSIRMDDQDIETMVVSGFSIDNMLDDRMVYGSIAHNGTVETLMKQFVIDSCIAPINLNRKIPNLLVSPSRGIKTPAHEINSYGNLAVLMKEFAIKYDAGWRILFDQKYKRYTFDVYEGPDHSIEQSVNPRLIFSSEYENVFNQTYTDSDTAYKNVALVAGEGEGPNRKTVLINDHLSGFDRKEVFVDARDITSKDEDGNIRPDSEVTNLLRERGLITLSEHKVIRTFESGISILSNLKYRKDFDLGYRVTIVNDKWGLVINTRITSIEEVYENNTTDIRVNFGSIIPTIADKLKKAVK